MTVEKPATAILEMNQITLLGGMMDSRINKKDVDHCLGQVEASEQCLIQNNNQQTLNHGKRHKQASHPRVHDRSPRHTPGRPPIAMYPSCTPC